MNAWFWVSVAVALVAVGLLAATIMLAVSMRNAKAEAYAEYDDGQEYGYEEGGGEEPVELAAEDDEEYENYESEPDDYL